MGVHWAKFEARCLLLVISLRCKYMHTQPHHNRMCPWSFCLTRQLGGGACISEALGLIRTETVER